MNLTHAEMDAPTRSYRRTALLRATALLAILAGLLVPACKKTPAPGAPAAPRSRVVVATIHPLCDVVRQLAGPGIDVRLLLPPTVSPHGYALTPADVQMLDKADLVVAVGGGLDNWALDAISDRIEDHSVRVVQMSPSMPAEAGHDHAPGAVNPHQWLVPKRMSELVADLSRQMQALYPADAQGLSDREDEVQLELAAIDVAYEDAINRIHDRRVVMFHDAFGPLCKRYGIDVVATVLDVETLSAVPHRLEKVRNAIKQDGVRAVFSEPQFDPSILKGIVGDVIVRSLDPIGGPGVKGYDSYRAMMESNLKALLSGLRDNEQARNDQSQDQDDASENGGG